MNHRCRLASYKWLRGAQQAERPISGASVPALLVFHRAWPNPLLACFVPERVRFLCSENFITNFSAKKGARAPLMNRTHESADGRGSLGHSATLRFPSPV